jgi:hypothetical protein
LRRLLVLPGFMMADRASGGRAQQTVMTRHVPRCEARSGPPAPMRAHSSMPPIIASRSLALILIK